MSEKRFAVDCCDQHSPRRRAVACYNPSPYRTQTGWGKGVGSSSSPHWNAATLICKSTLQKPARNHTSIHSSHLRRADERWDGTSSRGGLDKWTKAERVWGGGDGGAGGRRGCWTTEHLSRWILHVGPSSNIKWMNDAPAPTCNFS